MCYVVSRCPNLRILRLNESADLTDHFLLHVAQCGFRDLFYCVWNTLLSHGRWSGDIVGSAERFKICHSPLFLADRYYAAGD